MNFVCLRLLSLSVHHFLSQESPSHWRQPCLTTNHVLRHLDQLSGDNTTYTNLAAKVKPKCSNRMIAWAVCLLSYWYSSPDRAPPTYFFFSPDLHNSQDLPVKKEKKWKVDFCELVEDSHPCYDNLQTTMATTNTCNETTKRQFLQHIGFQVAIATTTTHPLSSVMTFGGCDWGSGGMGGGGWEGRSTLLGTPYIPLSCNISISTELPVMSWVSGRKSKAFWIMFCNGTHRTNRFAGIHIVFHWAQIQRDQVLLCNQVPDSKQRSVQLRASSKVHIQKTRSQVWRAQNLSTEALKHWGTTTPWFHFCSRSHWDFLIKALLCKFNHQCGLLNTLCLKQHTKAKWQSPKQQGLTHPYILKICWWWLELGWQWWRWRCRQRRGFLPFFAVPSTGLRYVRCWAHGVHVVDLGNRRPWICCRRRQTRWTHRARLWAWLQHDLSHDETPPCGHIDIDFIWAQQILPCACKTALKSKSHHVFNQTQHLLKINAWLLGLHVGR